MPRPARQRTAILIAFSLAAIVLACAGCTRTTIESEEGPVPEGMPVMYEFFTQS